MDQRFAGMKYQDRPIFYAYFSTVRLRLHPSGIAKGAIVKMVCGNLKVG